MKSIVQWALRNAPGMNTLVLGLIAVGLICLFSLRRETFPEFELEVINITVPYPGADPDETETGICLKIEEAVGAIDNVKEMTSIAQEGRGSVVLELDAKTPNVAKVLNEVRSAVDRISTFPELAEDPKVEQITFRETAIRLAVLGPQDESLAGQRRLRDLAENLRDELLQLDAVTQANLPGAREFEIDIEISEEMLRRYGLDLQDVAEAVRRENLDLPAGILRSSSQDIRLKGENKRLVGAEIAEIPLITDPSGAVLTVGDVATVKDAFSDAINISRVQGRPAQVIDVQRTSDEDLIRLTAAVRDFAANAKLPSGYSLMTWDDRSVEVQDRINLLLKNGWQGLLLVFLTLALFLELRLAYWVAAGIPISMLGACILLFAGDQTLNMLSLFAFLMVLGILVDDGIVIGENIYSHQQMGKSPKQAALDGASEVLPSVYSSVATTVIAFVPLMFVAGVMGKFIAVMPVAVIACLLFSLAESSFVLPVHLAHSEHEVGPWARAMSVRNRLNPFFRWTVGSLLLLLAAFATFLLAVMWPFHTILRWLNPRCGAALAWFDDRIYAPLLRWVLAFPALTITGSLAILLLTFGLVAGGFIKLSFFPDLDSTRVQVTVTFPDGTPENVTEAAVSQLHDALMRVNAAYTGEGVAPIKVVQESVGYLQGQGSSGQRTQSTGGHLGEVQAELVDPSERDVMSVELVNAWRREAPEIPGALSVNFESPSFGPAGKKIEFKLLGDRKHIEQLNAAVEDSKVALANYAGVFDVDDDSRPGKAELRIDMKPSAVALGVTRADLFETVRAAYFGQEVMRLQRGRYEVKLMVRLPEEDRRSFTEFDELRVRNFDSTGARIERPIGELAAVSVDRGPSEINRIDRLRSVTVTSDVDEAIGNATDILTRFQQKELPAILAKYPGVKVLWKGQAEQRTESFNSMFVGMGCAIVAMFALLTIEFKSYLQPLLILMIVPFGIVGALLGHWAMGLPVSFFSMMGLVALTGVVVNDSIVLVDFVNVKLAEGLTLNESLYEAGVRRLRPVFLTSATTVAGLSPMLLETSFQAQILVPMAASLVFGLLMTTGLVLLLLPAVYSTYGELVGMSRKPLEESLEDLPDIREPVRAH